MASLEKAECPEQIDYEFSPSVVCGDSSLVRGSQGSWDIPCETAAQREPRGLGWSLPGGFFYLGRRSSEKAGACSGGVGEVSI